MAVCCRIELLGGLRVIHGGFTITRFATQKTAALLAYLAYHREHTHTREALIEMLWPWATPAAGRNSLSTALCSLRHRLEPFGVEPGSVLLANYSAVQLSPETTTTDVVEFERALAHADTADLQDRARWLEEAIALYQDELLTGFYESWIAPEAERLAELYVGAANALAGTEAERGNVETAVSCLERAIELAPLREELYRRLMRLYATMGRSRAALETYAELEAVLAAESGAKPSASTQELALEVERLAAVEPVIATAPSRVIRRPAGRQAAASLPTGAATFLAVRVPEGAAGSQGLDVLRDECRRHGGVEVEGAGGGPTRVIAFARAGDALNCAAACQLAAGIGPTAMAVDTTEVARDPDGTYPRASLEPLLRLLAAANAAQILYSETAAVLVRRGLNGGLRLRELGTYRLRGADISERLFQLDYPGGPDALTPLGAESGYRSHLPLRLTRFFGREREMAELEALLAGEARLVTLVGGPGCGKTRLAIEVASQMVEAFAGRVWFVPLADVREGADILDRALDPLGITRSPHAAPRDQIASALADQPGLIVFDNFEQLIAAAGAVRSLLERLPRLRCLVTSRRRLDLSEEHTFAVMPLPTPDSAFRESLLANESVLLFVDRARSAVPDFDLTVDNAAAVAEICRRLDGIPLAIELAAARLSALAPAQVVARLEQSDLLTSRSRDEDGRHRSLRAAVEWSYSLLTPELQRFFARLSVFRGGWTAAAAAAVCEEPLALDHLAELVECSLVVCDTDAWHEPRFRLLEMIGQFAAEELAQSGDDVLVCDKHFDYFCEFAKVLREGFDGSEQTQWLEKTQDELGNFLALFEGRPAGSELGSYRFSDQVSTACNLQNFWMARAPALGLSLYAALLRHDDSALPVFLRGNARMNAGGLALYTGKYSVAHRYLEEGLTLRRTLGQDSVAGDLNNLAAAAIVLGDYARGRTLLEEALDINRRTGKRHWEAINLNNLGEVAIALGDCAEARRRLEPALAIYDELGDRRGYAMARGNLGEIAAREGDHESARQQMEESLAIFQELGASHHVVDALVPLAWLEINTGDVGAAWTRVAEALALIRERDLRPAADRVLRLAARIASERSGGAGALERAARLEGAAAWLREVLSTPIPPVHREAHETFVAALRTGLGDQAFDAAWEEGGAMTFQEAIAAALTLQTEGPPVA